MSSSPSPSPKVFIIIVNWNQPEHTIECLNSVGQVAYPDFQIVLIDNGSSHGSAEKIKKAFPDLTMLEMGKNLGFVEGNNAGIKYALEKGAEYVFLLNNDTVVDPEVLSHLVKAGESDPATGMLGAKIYNYYRRNEIDFVETVLNWKSGEPSFPGQGKLDEGRFNRLKEVEVLCGCAMLAKKAVIEKIGLMDPDFFAYYEDTDWCVRAKRAGFKLVFVPQAVVYHKGSVTNQAHRQSPMPVYYTSRNRLLFLSKNQKLTLAFHLGNLVKILILTGSLIRSLVLAGRKKTKTAAFWALRGIFDYYRGKRGKLEVDWKKL